MRSLVIAVMVAMPASPNPFIAEGRKPDQLIPEIVAVCADNGDAVIDANPYMVACEAIAKQTPGNAFLGSLLYGARNAQMKMTYRWTILPHEAGWNESTARMAEKPVVGTWRPRSSKPSRNSCRSGT